MKPQSLNMEQFNEVFKGFIFDTEDERVYPEGDETRRMKLGKFIKRQAKTLSDEDVSNLVIEVRLLTTYDLKFSTKPEVIAQRYKDLEDTGLQSCMTHPFSNLTHHPCEAYGKPGNMGLAILRNSDNKIIARAICQMDNKSYTKIYGDHKALSAILDSKGYFWSEHFDEADFNYLTDDDTGEIIFPYLDAEDDDGRRVDVRHKTIVSAAESGDYCAKSQYGDLPEEEDQYDGDACNCCGYSFGNGEDREEDSDGNSVCESCFDEHYIEPENSEGYYHMDDLTELVDGGWVRHPADDADYAYINAGEHLGEYAEVGEVTRVYRNSGAMETWHDYDLEDERPTVRLHPQTHHSGEFSPYAFDNEVEQVLVTDAQSLSEETFTSWIIDADADAEARYVLPSGLRVLNTLFEDRPDRFVQCDPDVTDDYVFDLKSEHIQRELQDAIEESPAPKVLAEIKRLLGTSQGVTHEAA